MSATNKRLLYVVNHSEFFLSHRLPLALAAREKGYHVHVATMPTPAAEHLAEYKLPWHQLPLEVRSMNPVQELALTKFLYGLYRRLRPDIVHHVTIKPVLFGGIAARFAGVPAVVNALSGLGFVFISDRPKERVVRAGISGLLRYALGHSNSSIILQNPDDIAEFVQRGLVREGRVTLIRGSGVDLEKFQSVPEREGTPIVVLPSRLLTDKGVEEFVEAARILRMAGSNTRFALVGDIDANNPASLQHAQLEAWRRDGNIEWWGYRNDMPEVLRESHIVCLPSYREGLPKALIEAAAAGRPIVTTDVPGCREIVKDGRNGLLVPARDASALAVAIATLLHDRAMRQRMGEEGRRMAEAEFSVQTVISKTLDLYDRLLAQAVVQKGGLKRQASE